jgi:NAD(P)-dependent dehydrogenase (short-subunit alcohol dehydrogenase family)
MRTVIIRSILKLYRSDAAMATIIMTGATSGIGRVAAQRLIAAGHHVIVGARGDGAPESAERRPLDLASLASVRAFADGINAPVDAVVLNAGMQRYDTAARTVDGFEQTFAVNHLAHYLLARLLLPTIADGGRLILTSSGTHDPAEKTGIPAPRHADAAKLADPVRDDALSPSPRVAGLRAYSTSKLCNLMTARSLAADADVRARGIAVHAYDPGFIPETRLARQSPWVVRKIALPVLATFPLLGGMNSLDAGGAALAGLADGSITHDRVYMSLRKGKPTWPDPSALARDDAACAKLWADSAAMVGV